MSCIIEAKIYLDKFLFNVNKAYNFLVEFFFDVILITNGDHDNYKKNCDKFLIKYGILKREHTGLRDFRWWNIFTNIIKLPAKLLSFFFVSLYCMSKSIYCVNKAMALSFYESIFKFLIDLQILYKFSYVDDNWIEINKKIIYYHRTKRLYPVYKCEIFLPFEDERVKISFDEYVTIPKNSIKISRMSSSEFLNKTYIKFLMTNALLLLDYNNNKSKKHIQSWGFITKWVLAYSSLVVSDFKIKRALKLKITDAFIKFMSEPIRTLLESNHIIEEKKKSFKKRLNIKQIPTLKKKNILNKILHTASIIYNKLLFEIKKFFFYTSLFLIVIFVLLFIDITKFITFAVFVEKFIYFAVDVTILTDNFDLIHESSKKFINSLPVISKISVVKETLNFAALLLLVLISIEIIKMMLYLFVLLYFLIVTTALHAIPSVVLFCVASILFFVTPESLLFYNKIMPLFLIGIYNDFLIIATSGLYLTYLFFASIFYPVAVVCYLSVNFLFWTSTSPYYLASFITTALGDLNFALSQFDYVSKIYLHNNLYDSRFIFYYNAVVIMAFPAVMFAVATINYFNMGITWLRKSHVLLNCFFVMSFLLTFPFIAGTKKKESFVGPLSIDIGSMSVNLTEVEISNTSIIFSNMVIVIYSFCSTYAYFYLKKDQNCAKFMLFLTMFSVGMIIIFTAVDLVIVFLGWEIIGLSSFFLISHYNKKTSSFKSGMKAAIFNKLSDYIFIIFIIIYIKTGHSTKINDILMTQDAYARNSIVYFLILFSFVKSAQIIFNGWLLDSMDAPVPASALIHSATLVVAGIYLSLRFKSIIVQNHTASEFLLIACAFSGIVAAAAAVLQTDMKRILANSTISNCSIMFILVLFSSDNNFWKFLFLHGILKSLCFLSSGVVFVNNKHVQDVRYFNNNNKIIFMLLAINCFVLLSSAPFTLMYDIKHMVVNYVELSNKSEMFKVVFQSMYLIISILSVAYGINFSLRIINLKNSTNKFSVNFKKDESLCGDTKEIFMIALAYFAFFLIFNYIFFSANPSSGFINILASNKSSVVNNLPVFHLHHSFVVFVSKIFSFLLILLLLLLPAKEISNNTQNDYTVPYTLVVVFLIMLL